MNNLIHNHICKRAVCPGMGGVGPGQTLEVR
jgi:hypothetical protein